jgi:hypothetical protein
MPPHDASNKPYATKRLTGSEGRAMTQFRVEAKEKGANYTAIKNHMPTVSLQQQCSGGAMDRRCIVVSWRRAKGRD